MQICQLRFLFNPLWLMLGLQNICIQFRGSSVREKRQIVLFLGMLEGDLAEMIDGVL